MNTGALKATHRRSHEYPEALVPGRIEEFEIWAVGVVFQAGHRVRVDLSTSDFPFFESNPLASNNLVYHDAEHPSRLVLPVVRR